MNLKEINVTIKEYFADKFQKMTELPNDVYLGDLVINNQVKILLPTIAQNVFTGYGQLKNCQSSYSLFDIEETVFETRFSQSLFKTKTELNNFTKLFIETSMNSFKNRVKSCPLVGTILPTLQPPGFEYDFVREIEPGLFCLRLYTNLTPQENARINVF
jgi:hypothetical protein